MKLLLTSDGITSEAVKEQFVRLLERPLESVRLLRISYNRDEDSLARSKAPLIKAGIKEENMELIDIAKDEKVDSLEKFDVVYVLGGNTFTILDKIRKLGLEKPLKDFIRSGKLYIGLSAGSMLVGPNIEVSGIEDENETGLEDLRGFNVIDIEISPHFNEAEEKTMNEFKKKVNYKIMELRDGQALVVTDKEKRII